MGHQEPSPPSKRRQRGASTKFEDFTPSKAYDTPSKKIAKEVERTGVYKGQGQGHGGKRLPCLPCQHP